MTTVDKFIRRIEEHYNLPEGWKKRKRHIYSYIRKCIAQILFEEDYDKKYIASVLEKHHTTLVHIFSQPVNDKFISIRSEIFDLYLETLLSEAESEAYNYIGILSFIRERLKDDKVHPLVSTGISIEEEKIKTAEKAISVTLEVLGMDSEVLTKPLLQRFKEVYYQQTLEK